MSFHTSFSTAAFAVIVMIAAVVCCVLSWRRNGGGSRLASLEVLRFVLIGLAVFTLLQPEWTSEHLPTERPTLVVLRDVSGSMATRDEIPRDQPNAAALSRQTVAQPWGEVEAWSSLADRMQIEIEPFSSQLPDAARGTDLAAALQRAADRFPQLRRIVMISDGDWNLGEQPAAVASRLRMKNIPVDTIAVGSPNRLPDLALTAADAPTYGVVGKTMRLPFRIANWFPDDREITLTLSGTGEQPLRQQVRVRGMGQSQESLAWKPEVVGDFLLTMEIPSLEQDSIPENNQVEIPLSIREESLQVLIIDSLPRWEFRFLRNALERDPGVDVKCLLFHPDTGHVGGGRNFLETFPTEKELLRYDVIFLGDVGLLPGQLTAPQCVALRQMVRSQAAGIVFLPGVRGYQQSLVNSALDELCPVQLDPAHPKGQGGATPGHFSLTESGRRSLLMRLEADDADNERLWTVLPGFQWHAAALRPRAGAQVLAVHDSYNTSFGRSPLVATRTSGAGKVLFMGTDAAWRWRRGVEDLYHYRFWGQVVRWMAYQRKMSQGEQLRVFFTPDRPEADAVVTLNANALDRDGAPLREGRVIVQAQAPSGKTETVQLRPGGEDNWGLFTGSFVPREGGTYRLLTSSPDVGGTLETTLIVQGKEREQVGLPARWEVLQEISHLTRGEQVSVAEAPALLQRIADLPEPAPLTVRHRLWSHPLWAGLLVALLCVFWIGRKAAGLL